MNVEDYAKAIGISPQRVRELAREGKIAAHREGRTWVIDAEPRRRAPGRRPLAAASAADLITYFDTRKLDHVTGVHRTRLAARVRTVLRADNPAAVLRDYFAGLPVPEGYGGAAIVRAALKGFDDQVAEVVAADPRWVLDTPAEVAGRLRDRRLILGLDIAELAVRAEVSPELVKNLERYGAAPRGNVDAVRVLRGLNTLPAVIHATTGALT